MVAGATQARSARHAIVLRGLETAPAYVDTLRMEQVLTNLLDNAVKYSPEGGDIIVDVSSTASDAVQISVRDYGIGIPGASLGRVFDRFYQAHENSSTSGMGLGLYISRQIVELHGGQIAVSVPVDGGSRFIVTIPSHAARPDHRPVHVS
jgi:signal transduction histidine kinase